MANLRYSLWSIAKALFTPKLLVFFGMVAINVVVLCWLLGEVGLWSTSQIPSTVLWFAMGGCVFAGRALQSKEDDRYFRNLFRGSLKLGGIFEFIVVAYTFGLIAELILVPCLFLLGATLAVAGTKPEYSKAKTLLEAILAVFALVLVWNSVSSIWAEPAAFFTTDTGRNFILPILLTVGSIPVFYLLFCYSHIEQARIQIEQKTFQSDDLKRYARKRFFLTFVLRPWLLRRATRQFHVLPAWTKSDVEQIITDILNYERNEELRPEIEPAIGWSPYTARDFLKNDGLRTNDYHKGFEEYWATAPYIELDDHILPNKATFYLEGEADVVKTLKLTGKFRDDFDGELGRAKFQEIAQTLCQQAIGHIEIDLNVFLLSTDDFRVDKMVGGVAISSWTERYPSGTGYEVFFTISR